MAKARRGRKPRPRPARPRRRWRAPASTGGPTGRRRRAYASADDANRYALQARLEDGVQLDPYAAGSAAPGTWATAGTERTVRRDCTVRTV